MIWFLVWHGTVGEAIFATASAAGFVVLVGGCAYAWLGRKKDR